MSEPLNSYFDPRECTGWEGDRILSVVRGKGGWLRKRQRRAMVLHLLAGCQECGDKVRNEAIPQQMRAAGDSCEGAEVAEPRCVDRSYYPRALERLGMLERPAQELYLNGIPGLRTEDFVEWLAAKCRLTTTREPERAIAIAKLAVLASHGVGANAEATAAMRMGQALRRARGDFLGADTWFEKARVSLSESEAEAKPELLAKLLRLQGLSRFAQSRSAEALVLFNQAARIYQTIGDLEGLAKTLVDQSGALEEAEGPEAAVGSLMKACCFADLASDPRLALVIAQNLSLYYTNLGQTELALNYLDLARQLLEDQGSAPADALRMDWTAGRILSQAARPAESVTVFKRARDGFVELGLAAEAGQISLDLALSLLALGRMTELREVAEEMLPIFRSRLLHNEALAAIDFFRQAAMAETITASQIHAVSAFLSELEANSKARFRKPAQ